MKKLIFLFVLCLYFESACVSTSKRADDLFNKDNVIAWCIVPFDANNRTPEERVSMLKELGIKKLAYDYRDEHIPCFKDEIAALKVGEIELASVWLWIQAADSNLLDRASEEVIKIVEATSTKTEFWVSFPEEYFLGLSDKEKLNKAINTLSLLNSRVEKAGCTLALYNHGSWFGNPLNQIKIIESIGSGNIGIVYNFHHAHHEIDEFNELFPLMLPYLTAVNLNGMRKEGPKIITLGEGDEEMNMIRTMIACGYKGPIGILGHTEGEDIKLVLKRNLIGLEKLKANI